jgi:hypothetical protein
MCALFKAAKSAPIGLEVPRTQVPELQEAQLAAGSYGQRTGGDSHHCFRVSPTRVLFAILDVAGRLDQNRAIVAAAQDTLRLCGAQLLANDDVNEADSMIEVCVQMNRSILKAAGRVCFLPGVCRLLQRKSGNSLLRQCRPYARSAAGPGRGLRTSGHRFTPGPVLTFRRRRFHRGSSAWCSAPGGLARHC